MNLKDETIEVLTEHDKKITDIAWIGSNDGYIPISEFFIKANVRYDSGFGGQEVADDLVIVGNDFYMTRGEYDGSEWWDYHSMDMFQKPENKLINYKLTGNMWSGLKDKED